MVEWWPLPHGVGHARFPPVSPAQDKVSGEGSRGTARGLGFPEPMGVRVEAGPPGSLRTERIRQLPGIRAGSREPEQCRAAGPVCIALVPGGTALSVQGCVPAGASGPSCELGLPPSR